jgi:glucose/arabinose dehydrogenase
VQAATLAILMLLSVTPAFAEPTGAMPSVNDPDFVVERFASGIPGSPTSMAFVGDDIIVLQKYDGQVRLVRDGQVQLLPLLDKNVDSIGEQGMLGAAAAGSTVYLYFSESQADGQPAIARRIYKYDWTGSALENETLLRDMNSTRHYHNGGGMAVGPDGTVYLVVGDTGRYGQLQNLGGGAVPGHELDNSRRAGRPILCYGHTQQLWHRI